MLGFGLVLAVVIIWLRRSTPGSPRWLAQNGHEVETIRRSLNELSGQAGPNRTV